MHFLYIEDEPIAGAKEWAEAMTKQMQKSFRVAQADDLTELRDPDFFSQYLQEESVDLIFIAVEDDKRWVQRFLNATRSLRIPYILLLPGMQFRSFDTADAAGRTILAPVTMLEEEVHKAEYIGHLSHYLGVRTTLLLAKDYGHRAARNANRISQFLEKQGHQVATTPGKKDSLSLYKEVPDRLRETEAALGVVTASRDYGLDDILFGPAERSIIMKAQCPIMLLNPRGDLFSLCD